jgi:hypothetical protein
MGFCIFADRLLGAEPHPVTAGAAVALATAVLVYLNPIMILLAGTWCGFVLLKAQVSLSFCLRFACSFSLVFVASLLPWMARNHRVFGSPVLMRDDLGIALHASNNDCARATLIENLKSGCAAQVHPTINKSEARQVAELGEVEYNRQKLQEALTWIRSHPLGFKSLTVERMLFFWLPAGDPLISVVTILGVIGLALLARRRGGIAIFIVLVFAVYPLVYYVVEAQVRYRYPILWLSLVCAGYLLERVRRVAAGRMITRCPAS